MPEGHKDSVRVCDRSYFYDALARDLESLFLHPESTRDFEFKNDGFIRSAEDISVRRALKLAKKDALSVQEISPAGEKPPELYWDGREGVKRGRRTLVKAPSQKAKKKTPPLKTTSCSYGMRAQAEGLTSQTIETSSVRFRLQTHRTLSWAHPVYRE